MRPFVWITIFVLLLRGTALHAPPMFADESPPSIAVPDSDPATTHIADRLTSRGMEAIRLFSGTSLWLTTTFSTHRVGHVRLTISVARVCARNIVDHSPLHAQSVQWQI